MTRQIVDLNGSLWQLGQSPPDSPPHRAVWSECNQVDEWLAATVPGNVRADLIAAGRLSDLHVGLAPESAQWVDNHCWWLVRRFSVAAGPQGRVHLILRGVDYTSDLFFNGQHLGRHEGMFSPQIHEVTGLLRDENCIAVRLVGSRWLPQDRSTPVEKLLNRIEARFGNMPDRFPHRRDTLKCQMGFGWDFAPPLRTMGIWDDVYAVVSEDVFIQEVTAQPHLTWGAACVTVRVRLNAQRSRPACLRCTLTGETFQEEPTVVDRALELVPGTTCQDVQMVLTQPRLWWPWDHGRPDLYRLNVSVEDVHGVLDSVTQMIGVRQVTMRDWRLQINGRRVYARGANWVPVDLLPGRARDADYHNLLTLARQANMNLLRVWGGGLREKRAFYDHCDRLGILVWQEFPLACAFLTRFPRSREYRRLLQTEARAIVRDLCHHPSVALWCGGNEFSPRRNAPLVTALERIVATEDPTRPFLPASPAGGDSHNWQVWHEYEPPSAYRRDRARFASEFGLQAPPSPAALRRFIPPEELWPPGRSWAYHGAGLKKLRRYARPFLTGPEPDLESFVQASQYAQAQGLKMAIEHYRRRKAAGCGGLVVWQLNEPWPAISWSLLDFYRQPKLAYEIVKRLFSPLLISLDYEPRQFQAGDAICLDVWVINDGPEPIADCQTEVVLWSGSGQMIERFGRTLDVDGDSAEIVARLDWRLGGGEGWRLSCTLTQRGRLLAMNEYHLAAYDGLQPTLRQRLSACLTGLMTPT